MKNLASAYPTLTGDGAERLREGDWRVAIVGAGGWIGLAALEELHGLLADDFHRRVVCFGSNARRLSLRGGLMVDQRPLEELSRLPRAPTLVLHLAFLTQEKAGLMPTDEYVRINRSISEGVYSALDLIGAVGIFVASSGAVSMAGKLGADPNKALYGALKLDDEARFSQWAVAERGRRAVNARIYGLSGPYINKLDSYALSCFIDDVLAKRPISIRAGKPVFRSYVAVDELMSIVFGLLTDGMSGATTFDTGAERGYEMAEIARDVADALGHEHGIVRPDISPDDIDSYVGDGATYRALRHRFHVQPIDFARQARETAKFMAETLSTV